METSIELITPEIAAKILENNMGNRKPNGGVVKRYAQMMLGGDWETTHQGIAIGSDGRLLDGQHRLMAVAISGVSVNMLVSRGVPLHQYYIFDAGYKREDWQNLNINKKQCEVAKMLLTIANVQATRAFSPSEILATSDLIEVIHNTIMEGSQSTPRIFGAAPVRSAACAAVLLGESTAHDAAKKYKALVNYHMEEFTPTMQAFARQVANGTIRPNGGGVGRIQLMTRVYPVFTSEEKTTLTYSKRLEDELSRKIGKLLKGRIKC